MKACVTGATGFIGGNLVKGLLAKKHSVKALVLPHDPKISQLQNNNVEVIQGDIRDLEYVKKAMKGCDVVFHCAAVVTDWAPQKLFEEVTVGGAKNVCEAALWAKVKRVVDISTNDVFGLREDVVMDESFPLEPWGEPYPDYKIKAEEIMWRYYQEKKLPVTMVYPCWVYGPGDQTFVPLLADAIIKRELIFWRKDVLVWPTYVENLVDLLLLIAVDRRAVGNGYLVHDGKSVTLQKFCQGIAHTLGVKPITTHIPYWTAYGIALIMEMLWKLLKIEKRPLLTTYTVKNLGSRLQFSIAKAKRELGWTPKISFEEGFARTMQWLKTLDVALLKMK
ncbi:MAG: NAD-dependent epimerase/dehydratase family protein [Spirochaetota bacterium]